MNKNISIIFLLSLASLFAGNAQNNQPYLGQAPPGMTAQRFPPDSLLGNSNWWWHGSPVFTPDGLEMFWTEYVRYSPTHEEATLFTMKVENNNWGPSHHPEFGNVDYMENNPVFSAGGDTLYFSSLRPGGPYFRVTRTATGWSQPVSIYIPVPSGTSSGMDFSVNTNGDFFLELYSTTTQDNDIYVARYQYGHYKMATKLGDEINSVAFDGFPFADPDEKYLIFASNRPGGYGGYFDMYISYKNTDETWTTSRNMGYDINCTGAWFASVTLDKQYLFFNTAKPGYDNGYNPYWISAAVIDSLQLLANIEPYEQTEGQSKLYQNTPNPFRESTQFVFKLDKPSRVSLIITDMLGKQVAAPIWNQNMSAGEHREIFYPEMLNLQSGIFFYSLITEKRTFTKKMIIAEY